MTELNWGLFFLFLASLVGVFYSITQEEKWKSVPPLAILFWVFYQTGETLLIFVVYFLILAMVIAAFYERTK